MSNKLRAFESVVRASKYLPVAYFTTATVVGAYFLYVPVSSIKNEMSRPKYPTGSWGQHVAIIEPERRIYVQPVESSGEELHY